MTSNNRIKYVSEKLSLPLFMVSRNRFREDFPRQVPNYIAKKRHYYVKRCNEENLEDTRTKRRFNHLVGIYPPNVGPCVNTRSCKSARDRATPIPWHLPPNLYDTVKEPFRSRRGVSGAYWRKLNVDIHGVKAKAIALKRSQKGYWKFYDVIRESERMTKSCHKFKGHFLSNARKRQATARCMISDPTMVYRDPTEPSPAHYSPCTHETSYKSTKLQPTPLPVHVWNPHLFLKQSCVPEREFSLIPRHMSYRPAVGRYEVRFPKICPCPGPKEYLPGLQLIIEHQKRLKFRRQPYTKIKARKYCSPDFEHVVGHGHRFLFRLPAKMRKAPTKVSKDAKKSNKTLQLYPDSRYIAMITLPMREIFSIRSEKLKQRLPKVRYNCLAKRHIRRQLRNNKKIVFNSGADRFPDMEWRAMPITVTQLEKLKASLPLDRQLRDHPITRTPLSEIKSLLYETPEHMKPAYALALRKRLFKFLPLPGPKVLVTESDLLPASPDGQPYQPTCYYNKPIDPAKFMKLDVTKRLQARTTESNIVQQDIKGNTSEEAVAAAQVISEVAPQPTEAPTS